ncbi:hypothetical protein TNIN_291481 [Trichonephila inaurata madagascariensis]|uniref:Uncharacterized protein n=1 Tax=Trichonephila inaurata madagascariensis TaxID=2747483 RepID=A0A8X6YHQ2_9ARAC|nr:hypothetical protein TNIN_291481 [Trichonephila inaurata madagascariensis]
MTGPQRTHIDPSMANLPLLIAGYQVHSSIYLDPCGLGEGREVYSKKRTTKMQKSTHKKKKPDRRGGLSTKTRTLFSLNICSFLRTPNGKKKDTVR